MYCGSFRTEGERGWDIWKNNEWKLPKFDERHKYKHLRNWTNSKEDEFKETCTETHYNQTAKDREFQSRKRQAMCHIQGTLNKITSKFLIRNFVGQGQWADIFKMLKENMLSASFLGQPWGCLTHLPSHLPPHPLVPETPLWQSLDSPCLRC